MFKPKFAITPKINKALVEIERVRGFLDAVKLKDEWIADMQKNALILESHHSTHIEGTALTLEQAKSILEGKKLKGINRDDEKELGLIWALTKNETEKLLLNSFERLCTLGP